MVSYKVDCLDEVRDWRGDRSLSWSNTTLLVPYASDMPSVTFWRSGTGKEGTTVHRQGFVHFWVLKRLLCSGCFLGKNKHLTAVQVHLQWLVCALTFSLFFLHTLYQVLCESGNTRGKKSHSPTQQNYGADHDRDHDCFAMELALQKLWLFCFPVFLFPSS